MTINNNMNRCLFFLYMAGILYFTVFSFSTVNAKTNVVYEKPIEYQVTLVGKDGSVLKKVSLPSGSVFTLPSPENEKGYTFQGWDTVRRKKGKPKYQAGNCLKIRKNRIFYSVYSKNANEKKPIEYQLELINRDGSVFLKETLPSGSTFTLPCLENEEQYTFQGWDTVRGKSRNPKYQAGECLIIEKNRTLYSIYFKNADESELKDYQITKLDKNKYSALIVVGSSSIFYTGEALSRIEHEYLSHDNTFFIARGCLKLKEFIENKYENTGLKDLLSLIRNLSKNSKKQIAVVFALGRNDVIKRNTKRFVNELVSFLDSFAKKTKDYNVKLFYESLYMLNDTIVTSRSQNRVVEFINYMKNLLPKEYCYIDMYSFLARNGFSFLTDKNPMGDGLHFSDNTYLRMHNQRIRVINNAT